MTPAWMRKRAFAKYAGVGEQTVSKWLAMGIPSAKVAGGSRLINVEMANDWLKKFMVEPESDRIEREVDELLQDFQ